MASPFTAYLAGVGTVIVALAVGFGGALVLVSSSTPEREQKSAYERRIEAARDKPVVVTAAPRDSEQAADPVPMSPIMTAATSPTVSTNFSAPAAPAPWPVTQGTQLAPDPGV